jgi:hemerythrin-like domain-containing protein
VERITIGLISPTSKQLEALRESTGMSKTDIVNRAISLYKFIQDHLDKEDELLLKRNGSDTLELIRLL